MNLNSTPAQARIERELREFVAREVEPEAEGFDREGALPRELFESIARQGYWRAGISREYGGNETAALALGSICHEFGRSSASLLSVFTVHTIVTHTLERWGTPEQRTRFLPRLAAGALRAAFALSEPDAGSDAGNVQTSAVRVGDHYVVNGRKKWVSAGSVADVFLVLAKAEGGLTALLIEREREGVVTVPVRHATAFRAALTAQVDFESCRVPVQNVVGRAGFGFSHIANTALDHGRYCIAWGAAGLTRACLEASARYAEERTQFGLALGEHQLIRRKLARMYTDASAARLLCQRAGQLREQGASESVLETSTAKYFASQAAVRAALEAVQVHGANGFSSAYPVARYLRDAKVFEVIEGSNEMQELLIGEQARHGLTS